MGNVIGMKLRCEGCGQVFAIGSRGIDAAKKRCFNHLKEKGCGMSIRPINPPTGLTYVGESGTPEIIYDGVDEDKFWNSVKTAGMTHFTVMSPKLELAEV